MITLTKPVRFNYRIAGDEAWRFDVLAVGRRFAGKCPRDAEGALCVEEFVGFDGKVRVVVPLAADEYVDEQGSGFRVRGSGK